MWLTRNNAASDVLRGVTIYALPDRVPTALFKQAVSAKTAFSDDARLKQVKELADAMSAEDSPYQMESIVEIGSTEHGTGADTLLKSIAAGHVAECETDVDGKFLLTAIPSDATYLFSYVETDAIRVIWMMRLIGIDNPLNLHNENASIVVNRSPSDQ